jgi:hypothetical protein
MGQAGSSDLPDGLSGIFLREGMDRLLVICPSRYFAAAVASGFALPAKRSSPQPIRLAVTMLSFGIGLVPLLCVAEQRVPNHGFQSDGRFAEIL